MIQPTIELNTAFIAWKNANEYKEKESSLSRLANTDGHAILGQRKWYRKTLLLK